MADNHRHTDNRHTDGGDDNTWNAKFAFQVKNTPGKCHQGPLCEISKP